MSSVDAFFDEPQPEPHRQSILLRSAIVGGLAFIVTAIVLGGVLLFAPMAFGAAGSFLPGCGGG